MGKSGMFLARLLYKNNKMKAGNIILCVNDKTVEIASFLHVSRPNVSQMNVRMNCFYNVPLAMNLLFSFICSNECELYTGMKCAVQEFLSKLEELFEIQAINLIYASK
ncbi:hypothetical protein T01_7037 [Trichinella spiralis]|uniref:Uncharacterized protein n=1 Tax=Trichinella spiralis TaxID=6334 RepID=A0A0V1C1T8_TRISP|nr:hypothetical protein T01_7037 [Trichinella spiralis]